MVQGARSLRPIAVATAFGVALTLAVVATPFLRFAYFAPSLHVAIETASGLAALLAAYLVFGRFRHSGRLPELALVVAFVLLGFTNLILFALPTALLGSRPDAPLLWVGLLTRLLAGAMLAAASVAPPDRLRDPAAAGRIALAGSLSALATIASVVVLLGRDFPTGIDPSVEALNPFQLAGPPAIHSLQLVAMLLFAATAVGFMRRARRTGDDFHAWLATASALSAFAQFHYFLFPSLFSDWIYTGDLLRLASYLVILFGSAREIRRYWQRIAEAEVVEERRRLARELHDGVAQELAFIARRTRSDTEGLDAATAGQIAAAADRARSEARRAVAALSGHSEEPFEVALGQAVEHLAARTGVAVRLDVACQTQLAPDVREHLIRIACEAVSNAVKHSNAGTVAVEFSDREGPRLRVTDDGVGFNAAQPGDNGGFGLLIMRERAERLGGELRLSSRPGAGTEVLVVL